MMHPQQFNYMVSGYFMRNVEDLCSFWQIKRSWNVVVSMSLKQRQAQSLTCSSRDLASSETNSGMLRAVWRPIPAGWHRSSDYARTEGVERTDSYLGKQRKPDGARAKESDTLTPGEQRGQRRSSGSGQIGGG